MQELDLILRGAGLGCGLLILITLLTGDVPLRKKIALVLFLISTAGYVIVSSPSLETLIEPIEPIFIFAAKLIPFTFTWAVLEILFDRIEGKWPWLLITGLTAIISLFSGILPILGTAVNIIDIVLHIALLVLVVITSADDLVAERRVFRLWFVVAMTLFGLVISAVEVSFKDADVPQFIFVLHAAAFLLLGTVFGIWVLGANSRIWVSAEQPKNNKTSSQKNKQLIAKLMQAMDEEVWREEGLTIGSLAQKIKLPEHQLRVVINQDLDFRNFSTFINGYRITAAMQALDDPEQSNRTILEIAYDIGFSSLGPFNKAFRQQTGKSPREYRSR
ncbi:AraC family transcriptional regulator [Amylibacter sp. SFDW26]|uniref:helix-turn-helix domain-containing protein n=1 Tax=Amylibacter sp. SFDW26 TaxID=2652722 RepID=UPI001261DE99|nr:helix-turn-helix domain-containing protein [Amylibacter sp. SFDW26]KAB7615638.1 AraC family transcriptional regulator [Amylibacter sp. SFDW26]